MTCYICLEQGELMNLSGCSCKGTISIHQSCFKKWMEQTDNPFQCSVCKTEFKGTFLNQFLTNEEILFSPINNTDADTENDPYVADEVLIHQCIGINFLEVDGELLFENERQEQMYYTFVIKEKTMKKKEWKTQQKNNKFKQNHLHQQSHKLQKNYKIRK